MEAIVADHKEYTYKTYFKSTKKQYIRKAAIHLWGNTCMKLKALN